MTNGKIVIGKAAEADLPALLALQKEAFQEEAVLHGDPDIAPLVQSLSELREDFKRWTYLKAEFEGRLAGMVRAQFSEGGVHIGRLAVSLEFRNRGIGKALMVAAESLFPKARRFELFTGHKSERNLVMYGRLGYREYDRKPVNGKLTHVWMEKKPAD